MLTYAVIILATNGWERSESASFGHAALEAICQRFQIPLEAASLDVSAVQEFNAVDSGQWKNVLGVVELLFCLPMSNGYLERVFSQYIICLIKI